MGRGNQVRRGDGRDEQREKKTRWTGECAQRRAFEVWVILNFPTSNSNHWVVSY